MPKKLEDSTIRYFFYHFTLPSTFFYSAEDENKNYVMISMINILLSQYSQNKKQFSCYRSGKELNVN